MAEGYYFSRKEYLKNLNDKILANEDIARDMSGYVAVGSSTTKRPEILSLEGIVGDPAMAKSLAIIELKKFMLPNDANKALSYLETKDEVGNYIQLSTSFYESIGKPVVYSYDNFVRSWELFNAKSTNLVPVVKMSKLMTDDEKLRKRLSVISQSDLSKFEKMREELMLLNELSNFNLLTPEEEERLEALKEEAAASSAGPSMGPSMGPSLDPFKSLNVEKFKNMDDVEKYNYFNSWKQLYDTKQPGKQAKFRGNLSNNVISKMLVEFFGDKSINKLKSKDELAPKINQAIQRLNPTGSGLKKQNKARVNVLKGEIKAGNTNPKIKRQLKKIAFK